LGAFPFWYGIKSPVAEEVFGGRNYTARLAQCSNCNLVQQPPCDEIGDALRFVYTTGGINNISAAAGAKGWGAQVVVELKKMMGQLEPHRVLEIGCGNGFLIDEWKARKEVEVAVGFDPSVPEAWTPNGAQLIRDYFSADRARQCAEHFDLVYSFGLLEHLPNALEVVREAASLLGPEGHFIAELPNCEASLTDGDLGMFVHEHLNYFTPETITQLCHRAGLHVEKIVHNRSEIVIHARKTDAATAKLSPETRPDATLEQYVPKCRVRHARIAELLKRKRGTVAFYGACLGLCNINALLPDGERNEFGVFDSDFAKWNHEVAGLEAVVLAPEAASFAKYSDIIIAPYAFQEEIYGSLEERDLPCSVWRAYEETSYLPGSWQS